MKEVDLEDKVLLDEVQVLFVLSWEHYFAVGSGELQDIG